MLPVGGTYIGLAPGSDEAQAGWPLETFIRLAKAQEYRVPIFFLRPQEQEWKDRIRAVVGSAIFPLQQKNSSDDPMLVVALAERMTASVANASGLGQKLALGGKPLVTLNGTEDYDTVVAALEKAIK